MDTLRKDRQVHWIKLFKVESYKRQNLREYVSSTVAFAMKELKDVVIDDSFPFVDTWRVNMYWNEKILKIHLDEKLSVGRSWVKIFFAFKTSIYPTRTPLNFNPYSILKNSWWP